MVSPSVKQSWAVSGVLLNMMAQGMVLSYPSCLLPAIRAPDSPIPTDLETSAWIASSVGIAGIPGIFVSAFCMERWGRRIAHGLVMMPGIAGWILLYFAMSVPALVMGRMLCGFTAAATVGLGAVVIGEYTSPVNRGMFLNLKTASVCMGTMFVHILANFINWRTVALMAVIPHIGALMVIYTWPKSPSWLASRKQYEQSEKAFFWLRGKDENSVRELQELVKAQMSQMKSEKVSLVRKMINTLKKFSKKDFLKPVFIIFLGCVLLEVSGRHLFPAYAMDIINEVTGNKSQSFYFTLGIDLIITASATFSSLLVKLMKRRVLLFGSGAAAVAVLFSVCLYLLLASRDLISKERTWIPIVLFVIYFILANLGCTPIPLAFLGELLPLEHRGAGSALAGIFLAVCVNVGLQVTPFLLISVKVYGTFAILGGCMAVILLILYFILPETKDRTLQEIEDFFNYGRFKDDERDDKNRGDEEAKLKMLGEIEVQHDKS